MVKVDQAGGSLAGNESLLASSTISVGLELSEACGQSSGAAPVSASPRCRLMLRPETLSGHLMHPSWLSFPAYIRCQPPG